MVLDITHELMRGTNEVIGGVGITVEGFSCYGNLSI